MKIASYSTDRAGEVAELLNAGLANKLVGVRDAEYWAWKHEQNPFGRSFMLLAEIDGRLAGVRAFMRWQFEQDQQIIHAAKPVDSVTHPDFQRRGIFSKLTLEACDLAAEHGIQFLFNTPNKQSTPGYLKLGWRIAGELPVHGKVLHPVRATGRAVRWKCTSGIVPPPTAYFRKQPTHASSILGDPRLGQLLSRRQPSKGQLETLRSQAFLEWRYGAHPHIDYYAEFVEGAGDIGEKQFEGVLFYRTNFRGGMLEIMIDDLIIRDTADHQVVHQLLKKLKQTTRSDYWVTQCDPKVSCYDDLRSARFFRIPKKRIGLAVRPLQANETVPQIERWSLCFGDLEGL
ncbi:GNAT family N-acetyltransferase [Rubripirellula sp.]|nr:GNAT family N-acetyltransferase [Rubripirellula sp.]